MSSPSSMNEDTDSLIPSNSSQNAQLDKYRNTRKKMGMKKNKKSYDPSGFEMEELDDDDEADYQELKQSLVQLRSKRSEIQKINYQNSPLLNLPTEVLLQIFNHLDRRDLFSLLTVCREFSELIIEILWFRPNMQSDSSFKHIRNIMSEPSSKTHWNYRLFIKRLNLSFMTKLVNDDLLSLFIGCPKLERLTLVNCNKLTKEPITKVLKNCERLQSIDLTGVTDIHDDILISLADNCPRLQGLYAPGCGNVSESSIITLLKKCPMLKRVKFNNSDKITDETILTMYQNCKSLVEIDLHNCPEVTDLYLRKIFLELSQLREFRISNAPGITDNLLNLLPNEFYLEKLRIIDITGCNAITDKFVEKLVICAPRLRNVVLSKCMQITDASLRALSQLGRSLHYIHLGHCLLITDFGVASLVRSCHRIQYIDLACCSQLTDWTLVELANLPKLRRIGLVKCGLITDNGIIELVRRRGEQDCLERVHLSYCTKLTLGPIYLLLKTCPRLTHLSLTGIAAFLRREITQYCREPPPDFNEYQKSLFCVFSGNGVNQLRNHLNQIMEDRAYLLDQMEPPHAPMNDNNRLGLFQNRATIDNPQNNINVDQNDDMEEDVPNFDSRFYRNVGLNLVNPQAPDQRVIRLNQRAQSDGNGQPIDRDEELLNNWARQRGLGILRTNQDQTVNDMQDINREIFQELNHADVSNEEFRNNFQRFLRNQELQRFPRRATGQAATIANPGAGSIGAQGGRDRRMGSVGSNAPQIFQPAVFPAGNDDNIPVINDDAADDDVEMQAAYLFPRANNNGAN